MLHLKTQQRGPLHEQYSRWYYEKYTTAAKLTSSEKERIKKISKFHYKEEVLK
uniref:Uncharacterized protein n=1 Tax=uncultured Desulfobacterium sp. TaxID=201089 RepID=E1Y9S1_9BACT|nr:unknown protein [uncultured Desulfobacterium sp.]CBX28918.1 unknown protein [uncultured Desulfobacterium sp.]